MGNRVKQVYIYCRSLFLILSRFSSCQHYQIESKGILFCWMSGSTRRYIPVSAHFFAPAVIMLNGHRGHPSRCPKFYHNKRTLVFLINSSPFDTYRNLIPSKLRHRTSRPSHLRDPHLPDILLCAKAYRFFSCFKLKFRA